VEEERLALLATTSKYIVIGKEVGESGTPHLQGYIYFEALKSLAVLKRLNDKAHWEPARGTAQENYAYCTKEGNFEERGVIPATQEEKGKRAAVQISQRWELAKKAKFEELPPENIRTYEYIYRKYRERPQVNDQMQNLWIHGPSGCGKSSWVRSHYSPNQFYWKNPSSKWFDGFNHEPILLIEDYDPSHAKFTAYYLKIWCDHYPFNCEEKNGSFKDVRPKMVIVTSQYHPRDCFRMNDGTLDDVTYAAIERRFQIYFYPDGNIPVINIDVVN
jgi:hypothetical protein